MPQLADQIARYEALAVPQSIPPDFEAFWMQTLRQCERVPLNLCGKLCGDVRDLTYEGLDGTPVHAWLLLPSEAKDRKVPVLIHCHGANGSRGDPQDFSNWIEEGYAVLSPDFRMQRGETRSVTPFDSDGTEGWWILNLNDLKRSYLYCVWTDLLRAVRLARETPEIDSLRIAVAGHSQGGGLALGLASLDRSVALCMADCPSGCWMERRIASQTGGGAGIACYLNTFPERSGAVHRNLAYFDNTNLAPKITCPVLVSCGLQDNNSPPECTYAAYNQISSVKEMAVYPLAGHEGGGAEHRARQCAFMKRYFGEGEQMAPGSRIFARESRPK